MNSMLSLALFTSPIEWIVLGLLGLLIFGKRLPEVGRGLGKGIMEFKKGLSGIDDDVTKPNNQVPPQQNQLPPQQYPPQQIPYQQPQQTYPQQGYQQPAQQPPLQQQPPATPPTQQPPQH